MAGSSPARTTDDLPEPDGPTTASNRPRAVVPRSRSTSRSTRRDAAEEVGGVGFLERAQTLVGVAEFADDRPSPHPVGAASIAPLPVAARRRTRRRTLGRRVAPVGGPWRWPGRAPGRRRAGSSGRIARMRRQRIVELALQELGLGSRLGERQPTGQCLEDGDRQPVDVGGRADRARGGAARVTHRPASRPTASRSPTCGAAFT